MQGDNLASFIIMLVTSIRDYVQLKGRAALQDIARHFRIPNSATVQMLDFWIKKGCIQQLTIEDSQTACKLNQCKTCAGCNIYQQIVYVWLNK